MNKALILIPCYNEEASIEKVINNLIEYVLANRDLSTRITMDYIVINDCSKDNTLDILRNNNFNYINLPVNLGIGGGMQAGYLYAFEREYDIAIQHDGDGQHDPRFFENLILPIESGEADLVIGSRFLDNKGFQSTGLRRFGILFLSKLIYLCTGTVIHDVTSGFRAVNRKFIKLFAKQYAQDYPEPESILTAILNNARILEIPVIMRERNEGRSSISTVRSIYYMIKVSLAILLHRIIISKQVRENRG